FAPWIALAFRRLYAAIVLDLPHYDDTKNLPSGTMPIPREWIVDKIIHAQVYWWAPTIGRIMRAMPAPPMITVHEQMLPFSAMLHLYLNNEGSFWTPILYATVGLGIFAQGLMSRPEYGTASTGFQYGVQTTELL